MRWRRDLVVCGCDPIAFGHSPRCRLQVAGDDPVRCLAPRLMADQALDLTLLRPQIAGVG